MITIRKPEGALPYFMKKMLERLSAHETLTYSEAREILLGITGGLVNETQVAAFMAVFMMRPVTIAELSGFRDALREQALPLDLPAAGAIDIVGTGGDGKNTFNISTLSSFVVAGCGYPVIKHGNYGITSVSGSSDVLEYLGYRFTNEEEVLKRQLGQAGICFLHSPLFHPVMKRVASVRSNLGLRSFFNMLGPLTNPAQPGFLLLGVNTPENVRLFHYLLQDTPVRYRVLHTLDGHDELSLTDEALICSPAGDQVRSPEALGFPVLDPATLSAGKDSRQAAAIFLDVLQHNATAPQQQVVIANSAMALQCLNEERSFDDCVAMATESLLSGRAYQAFQKLIKIQGI